MGISLGHLGRLIFSTVGAFGGIMAGVGHITIFGLGDYAKSFKSTNSIMNNLLAVLLFPLLPQVRLNSALTSFISVYAYSLSAPFFFMKLQDVDNQKRKVPRLLQRLLKNHTLNWKVTNPSVNPNMV